MASKFQSFLVIYVLSVSIRAELKVFKALEEELRIHPYLPSSQIPRAAGLEMSSDFWHESAQATLGAKLQKKLNANTAKNIIMFLGDGMSLHTVTATRSLNGDVGSQLSFEKFPYVGLSKTYCVDKQVPDSACTSTAYLCGVKNNFGTIGLNAKVSRQNCTQGLDISTYTPSIANWAQDAGKDTGFVTTSRVTHASPAGLYAHTANRDWENDAKVREDGCDPMANVDIAQQLVNWNTGKNLKVILGGGRGEFLNATMRDKEGLPGWRTDGENLIEKWLYDHKSMGNASFIWKRPELFNVNYAHTDYLLGLFNRDHCSYHGDLLRNEREQIEPTLTEMTEAAIKILRKNEKGFFLFVEGARIDMAHHETRARKSLEDTEEMARAVQKAKEMTSDDDTLIVVTSDHAHTMTINGYAARGSNILGLSGSNGLDNLPYTSLSYANGPGFNGTYKVNGGGRRDISKDNFTDANYEYPATAPLDLETHGGDDVGVFATGPYAHIFTGNYEQNVIPLLMAYAAGIGPYEGRSDSSASRPNNTATLLISLLAILVKYYLH